MSTQVKKEFWIAFLINFFFPGGGHIYAGDTEKGVWILAIYLVCWILTPFIYIPGIVVLGTWGYALFTSKSVVEEYNENLIEQKEKAEKEEKKKIDVQEFIEQLDKAKQLFSAEIISENEFIDRKRSIISQLAFKSLDDNPDELLLAIASMKQSGDITDDEIKDIKKYILQ